MICKACHDWDLAEGDIFCPGCGRFTRRVRIEGRSASGQPIVPEIVLDEQPSAAMAEVSLAFALGRPDDGGLKEAPDQDLSLAEIEGTRFPLAYLVEELYLGEVIEARVATEAPGTRTVVCPVARIVNGPGKATLTLESPRLQADAVRPSQDRTRLGGWLNCRVNNSGKAVALAGATLKLSGQPRPITVRYDTPTVLLAGETAVISVFVGPEACERLAKLPGKIDGEIHLFDAEEKPAGAALSVSIERRGKLDVEVKVRPFLAALAGRDMRLPVQLRNRSGQVFEVVSAQLEAKGPEPPFAPIALVAAQGAATAVGDLEELEFRGAVPEFPTGVLDVILRLRLQGEGNEQLDLAPPFKLEIRPKDHMFEGRLCVDFGTTASAAAAVTTPAPKVGDTDVRPPFLVDLVRVSVDGSGEGDRFLPSQGLKLRGQPDLVFGAQGDIPEHDIEERFTGFKWLLERPEGLIHAVGYLTRLRRLIEEHPDIAAVLGPKTTVFATCPTRFPPGMRRKLVAAFTSAGFTDPRTKLLNDQRDAPGILIAESWSPLHYALRSDERLLKALGAQASATRPFLEIPRGQTGYVVIADVGGGSADISVLKIDRTAQGDDISETHRKTDQSFVGERFSDLVRASLLTRLRQIGRDPGDAIEALVRRFQFADGVFSGGTMRDCLNAHFQARLAGEEAPDDEALFRTVMLNEVRDTGRARLRDHFESLDMNLDGPLLSPPLGFDDLVGLASQVLADFLTKYLGLLQGLIHNAVHAAGGQGGRAFLVPSGRGLAFPLAQLLTIQAWRLCGGEQLCILNPREAKSITCCGGLYLADLAKAETNFTFRLSDDQFLLAFTGVEIANEAGQGERRATFQPLPWSEVGSSAQRVVALPLSNLNAGAIRNDLRIHLRFGDPDGEDAEELEAAQLTDEQAESRSDHWLVVALNQDLTFEGPPQIVRAGDARSAYQQARRQAAVSQEA